MLIPARVVVALAMALLVLVIYIASTSAIAQLLSYPARLLLAQSSDEEVVTRDIQLYQEAHAYIKTASAINTENSQLRKLNGEMFLQLGRADISVQQDYYTAAAENFRSAIQAEPANAVLWSRLLAAKTAQNIFDDEYAMAYARAFEYGQRDYRVMKSLVRLGFMAWHRMPLATRLFHRQAVRALYGKSSMEAIAIAREYDHVYMTCLWVRDLPLTDGYCVHELKKVP